MEAKNDVALVTYLGHGHLCYVSGYNRRPGRLLRSAEDIAGYAAEKGYKTVRFIGEEPPISLSQPLEWYLADAKIRLEIPEWKPPNRKVME